MNIGKMKHPNSYKILAFLITVILLYILLIQFSFADFVTIIKNINILFIGIGFVLYIFSYFFRTLRFNILMDRKADFKALFNIVCVSNMANNILPARIGELSYIYLLKKRLFIPSSEGIANLAVARIFDALSITSFFLISMILLNNIMIIPLELIYVGISMLSISILILGLLLFHGKKITVVIENISVRAGIVEFRFMQTLLKLGNKTSENLEIIQSRNVIFPTFVTSILIWIFMYSATYFLLLGVNIQLSIIGMVFASILPMMTTVLPIQGIGGFGTTEGAWTIGLTLFGISKEIAIASAFTIHIIGYIYFLILGLYGLIMFKIKK